MDHIFSYEFKTDHLDVEKTPGDDPRDPTKEQEKELQENEPELPGDYSFDETDMETTSLAASVKPKAQG